MTRDETKVNDHPEKRKPLIFISHIHEHGNLSSVLKSEIAGLLLGGVDFFVSSDHVSITGGDKWLDKVETALKDAVIVMVICTKESVHRPWVNFEAGGAWMSKKRVVPLCFGGFKPSDLPQPLASRKAYNGADSDDLVALVELIAQEAGLSTPDVPDTLVEKFVQALAAPGESTEAPAGPTLESKPAKIQITLKLREHYFFNDPYDNSNRENARRRVEGEIKEILSQLHALLARRFGPRSVKQKYSYELEFPFGNISVGSDEDLRSSESDTVWGEVAVNVDGNELSLLNEIRNHHSIRDSRCTSISFDFPGKIDMEAFAEKLYEREINVQGLLRNYDDEEITLGTLVGDVGTKISIRSSNGTVSVKLFDYNFTKLSLRKTVAPIFTSLRLAEHIQKHQERDQRANRPDEGQ